MSQVYFILLASRKAAKNNALLRDGYIIQSKKNEIVFLILLFIIGYDTKN